MSQPQPPASERQQQHNTYLSGYGQRATNHHEWRNASNSAPHLLLTLIHLATLNPQLTLLDVGAGSGTITASLASYMPQGKVIATDLSQEILQKAKTYANDMGAGNVEVQQANCYELPFEDGIFDVVHTSMMLTHLDDPKKAVKEMIRVA